MLKRIVTRTNIKCHGPICSGLIVKDIEQTLRTSSKTHQGEEDVVVTKEVVTYYCSGCLLLYPPSILNE